MASEIEKVVSEGGRYQIDFMPSLFVATEKIMTVFGVHKGRALFRVALDCWSDFCACRNDFVREVESLMRKGKKDRCVADFSFEYVYKGFDTLPIEMNIALSIRSNEPAEAKSDSASSSATSKAQPQPPAAEKSELKGATSSEKKPPSSLTPPAREIESGGCVIA